MQQSPPHASPDDIDIAAVWDGVVRNRIRLALAVLLIGGLTFLSLSMMTPQYKSAARIIIESDKSSLTRPLTERSQAAPADIDERTVVSQVQVLKSRDIHDRVAHRLELDKVPEFNAALASPVLLERLLSIVSGGSAALRAPENERVLDAFAEHLTVYPVSDSRVISVEFSSSDPQRAAALANTLADTYIEWQQGQQTTINRGASEWLKKQTAELRKQAEAAETELAAYRAETGLLSGANNTRLDTQELSEINSQLTLAKAQRSEAEVRAKQIQKMLQSGSIAAAREVLRSPLIQRLLEQRVRVQRQLSELSANLRPAHPRMRQLASELDGLSAQIRSEARKVVESLESEARVARAREDSLRQSLNELRRNAAESGDAQARLQILEREAQSKRELYEAYVARYGDANAQSQSAVVPVFARIVERARPATSVAFPKKFPITMLAMAAALLLGLAVVVTRELFRGARASSRARSIQHEHQAEPPTGAGILPFAAPVTGGPGGVDEPAMAGGSPDMSATLASLEDVAARLIHAAGEQPGYRTLVTGADRDEAPGKDARALARHLTASGETVVLVEWTGAAASKRPEDAGSPGITDMIAGSAGFEDVVQRDPEDGIHIMTYGTAEVEPDSETAGERLNLIFDALDEAYDQVVLAAPREAARAVFIGLSGRFDAALLVGPAGTRSLAAGGLPGTFLGLHVSSLMILHYERSKAQERPAVVTRLRRQPSPANA